MEVKTLKKQKPYRSKADKSLEIQTFGEGNSFPQDVLDITLGSGTAVSCLDVYKKFIFGRGFQDRSIYDVIVNEKQDSADKLLGQIAEDYATFRGFYLHINYNANFKIAEVQWIPFETVRLGKVSENGLSDKVAIHWDWAKQYTEIRKWKKEDIDYIDIYNPNQAVIKSQVELAGGWENYKGQVYIFTENRIGNYPLPKYFPVLTDMSTEQGVSNISYRNARNNFYPSGMLVDILDVAQGEAVESDTEQSLIDLQGDEDACKLAYTSVKSREELPEFISFQSKNYDKEFTVTDESCRGRIGRAFNQPPVLRAENIGAGFGADLIKNAYNYYNSVTENERLNVERVLTEVFSLWHTHLSLNFVIEPLRYDSAQEIEKIPTEILGTLTVNEKRALLGYEPLEDNDSNQSTLAEKIGADGVQSMTAIIADMNMTDEQKRGALKLLFSLSDEEVNSVIPIRA